jgi:hypothetical protein
MIVRLAMTARAWVFLCFTALAQAPVPAPKLLNAIYQGSAQRL